jgi:hypothetical protein
MNGIVPSMCWSRPQNCEVLDYEPQSARAGCSAEVGARFWNAASAVKKQDVREDPGGAFPDLNVARLPVKLNDIELVGDFSAVHDFA